MNARRYEHRDHLGNVVATFSDLVLSNATGSASNNSLVYSNYQAQQKSMYNYYAFGSPKPNTYNSSGTLLHHDETYALNDQVATMPSGQGFVYRFGFNGMHKDDEVKGSGNSLDFGARVYDSRLGRWLSLDPLQAKYPSLNPYNFCANTPICAKDPDGRLIFFVNGEVGQFGPIWKSNSEDRASSTYWSGALISKFETTLNDYNVHFADGDHGTTATERYESGKAFMAKNFEDIIAQLKTNKEGKIIENLVFVSHSKGSAFAKGMIDAYNELRNSDVYSDLFTNEGGQVEFNLMLAPHQSHDNGEWWPSFAESSTTNVALSHDGDALSGSALKGDVLNIRTDNGSSFWGFTLGKAHTVDGFHEEAIRAIQTFLTNRATPGCAKYQNFLNYVDQGDEGNSEYDSESELKEMK
jgi:RHS repeat-associated protein